MTNESTCAPHAKTPSWNSSAEPSWKTHREERQRDELKVLLEKLRHDKPEVYRHVIALLKQILATA